jgi:hypothetical protein
MHNFEGPVPDPGDPYDYDRVKWDGSSREWHHEPARGAAAH